MRILFPRNPKGNQILLTFFSVCIGIPIVIYQIAGTEVPLSDLAVLASIPYYFAAPNILEKKCLNTSLILSLVSILFTSWLVNGSIDGRPFVSMGYFFRPYLLFFAGYWMIRTYKDLRSVLALLSLLFTLVSAAIAVDILLSGTGVRIERVIQSPEGTTIGASLAGSLLGLPLYATWGVNSLAVFYATMFAIIFIYVSGHGRILRLSVLGYAVGMFCLLYFIVASLSREAILGTLAFLIFWFLDRLKRNRLKLYLLSATVVALALVLLLFLFYGDVLKSQAGWQVIVERSLEGFKEGSLDEMTSGRITLMAYAVSDLLTNPLLGSGFHGYLFYDPQRAYNIYADVNSSPHNQYLTAIWKMGLLPGVFYLAYLFKCLKNLYVLKRRRKRNLMYAGLWALMLAYVLVLCMLWDVLLVPLIGAFVMFLLGGIARIVRRTYSPVSTIGTPCGNTCT